MTDYKRGDVGLHGAENSYSGAGFFEAALSLDEAVKENDKVAIGIGSAGMALETLGMVLDPIGSLLTAGIGWLIEHISVLRWPLDMLMGDPVGIAAADAAITAEKAKLEQWATEHTDALNKVLQEWSGDAADQFKKDMDAVTAQLGALGGYVETAGKNMKIAGGLIGAFRGIVRDLIAMLLATIIKGALIAAALAPVTFGASIALFITTTIGAVAVALAKVGKGIANLVKKLGELLSSMAKLGKSGDSLVKSVPTGGGSAAPGSFPKTTPSSTPPPPKVPTPPAATPPPPKVDTTPSATPPPPKVDTPPAAATPPPPKVDTPPAAATPPPKIDTGGTPPGSPKVDPGGTPPGSPKPDGGGTPPPLKVDTTPAGTTPPPKVDTAGSPPGSPAPHTPDPTSPKPADPNAPDPNAPKPPDPNAPDPNTPKPPDANTPDPNAPDPNAPKPESKPFTDQMTQHIRDKLSKIDGVTPEILQKFDRLSGMPLLELRKVFGPVGADQFTSAMNGMEHGVKVLTDPWFGKSGLAGKTIVDLIKGVPASIGNVTGGGDDQ